MPTELAGGKQTGYRVRVRGDQETVAGKIEELEGVRLGVALEQALVNALYRGNLEISVEQMRFSAGSKSPATSAPQSAE